MSRRGNSGPPCHDFLTRKEEARITKWASEVGVAMEDARKASSKGPIVPEKSPLRSAGGAGVGNGRYVPPPVPEKNPLRYEKGMAK
jgi:hypothetical protein